LSGINEKKTKLGKNHSTFSPCPSGKPEYATLAYEGLLGRRSLRRGRFREVFCPPSTCLKQETVLQKQTFSCSLLPRENKG
jgi:hypothetical protein